MRAIRAYNRFRAQLVKKLTGVDVTFTLTDMVLDILIYVLVVAIIWR